MKVKRHAEARRRGGFTLVEVVIVIGLIVLLEGLVLSVSVSVVRGSEVRQTEQVLLLLDSALKEWEASSERKISWGDDGPTFPNALYEMQLDTPYILMITECLETIARVRQVKSVIALIDPQFVHTYDSNATAPPWILQTDPHDPNCPDALTAFNNNDLDGKLSVLDAWGRPILAVHPGRVRDPINFPSDLSATVDADGTIQVVLETACGIAANRQILFISAGPDGKFGDLSNADPEALEQTMDNVISYDQ